ncbi:MAG: prephenate dehydrogenase [Halobacteria archaeon]|nr:prephenate dehydrogenase [Halobacteria archaeon]
MKTLVVGGAGAMGRWFVEFFEERGYDVSVSDPDAEDSVSLERADDFDLVVVSVPIESTVDVVEEVAPRMSDGLLMDITSVKKKPVEAMRESTSEDVEVLGTHPMYGPSVRSMRGQTVILVEVRTGERAKEVISLFDDAGANIQRVSAEEHDRMMSIVQGLTHFSYITVGRTLERLRFDVDESRRFMSPVYEITLDFVGRILNQNPHLYADIQQNQPVGEVHDAFVETARELRSLVEEDDHDGFVDLMHESARHYGDTKSALRRSDKLIDAKVREYEELHESVGDERGLRHIYSDTVHVGVVEEIDGQTVYLDEGEGDDGRVELNTGNVELLSDEELRRWKLESLERHERDVSTVFGRRLDPDVLEDVLESSHAEVVGSEVIDVYDGEGVPDGTVSYTVRLEIIGDADPDEVVGSVVETVEGLGGEIRT